MAPTIRWCVLDDSHLIDIPKEPSRKIIEPGSGSRNKKVQALRERSVPPAAIYLSKNM